MGSSELFWSRLLWPKNDTKESKEIELKYKTQNNALKDAKTLQEKLQLGNNYL